MNTHTRTWSAVLFALVYPTLLTWVYFIALAGEASAVQQTAYAIGKAIQFAFPVIWTWLYFRSAIAWPRPSWIAVAIGLAFGAAVGGGMLLVYHFWLKSSPLFEAATQPILDKLTSIGFMSPGAFIALGVFYSLAHSLLEEYYWRWFVFARLADVTTLPKAIALSSLGFMAHHVLILGTYFGWTTPATWLFSLAIAIGGGAWAWLYHRGRSLIGPWISHMLVDAAIFVIGYDLVFGA